MAKALQVISLAALSQVYVERATLAAFLANESERTINYYQKRGLVVRGGHGRYLLLESVAKVMDELRKQAAGRIGKDENIDAARSKAMLNDTQRRYQELRIGQLEGRLISLEDVEQAWNAIALTVKQLFLSFPARARFDLPHLTGADQKILERLARDMLEEVATEGPMVLPRLEDGRARPSGPAQS